MAVHAEVMDRRKLLIGGSSLGAVALAAMLTGSCGRRKGGKGRSAGGSSSRRRPGEPKPLLEEDVRPVLARLERWYAAHLPSDRYLLNPPASDDQLDAFERSVGLKMPQAYRQLYRWHDGENDDRWGHFYGLPLLPLHQAEFQWKAWNGVLAGFRGDRYKVPGGAWPEGAVDTAYINPHWIPLTNDGSGNHIGVDFDPRPRGRVGQVILYGRDQDVKVVLAESLGKFLEWIARLLESGNFILEMDPARHILRQFRLRTPPVDDFQDGVRILRGAPGPYL